MAFRPSTQFNAGNNAFRPSGTNAFNTSNTSNTSPNTFGNNQFRSVTPSFQTQPTSGTSFKPMGTPSFGQNSSGSNTGSTQFRPIGSTPSFGGNTQTGFRPQIGTGFSSSGSGFRPSTTQFGTTTTGQSGTTPSFGSTQFRPIGQQQNQQVNQFGMVQTGQGLQAPKFGTQQQNVNGQQFSLSGNNLIYENEVDIHIGNMIKACSLQHPDNIYKTHLYNRYPHSLDNPQKLEYFKQYISQNMVYDASTNFQCPLDHGMIQKAYNTNPDKENLYPVQINSLKEMLSRQKTFRESDAIIVQEIKNKLKESENLEKNLHKLYFETAIKCSQKQMIIIIKYFKIISKVYYLAEQMSENISHNAPQCKLYLDTLERSISKILEVIEPQGQESLKQKLQQLSQAIGSYMYRQSQSKKKGNQEQENDIEMEETTKIRNAISTLLQQCKDMIFILAQQLIDNKSTLQIMKENV